MSSIKESVLEKKFIDTSVKLAKTVQDDHIKQAEKDVLINKYWREFRDWIYENFEEK